MTGMCRVYLFNNNIFISYIKYTSITPPANSKANRGRWCEDGLQKTEPRQTRDHPASPHCTQPAHSLYLTNQPEDWLCD